MRIAALQLQHVNLTALQSWEVRKLGIVDATQAYCLEQAARGRQPERAWPAGCTQLCEAQTGLAALHMAKAVAGKQVADVSWQDFGVQGSDCFHRLWRTALPVEKTITVVDDTELKLTSAGPGAKIAAAERLAAFDEQPLSQSTTAQQRSK